MPIEYKPDGSIRLLTELTSAIEITAQTPQHAKDKIVELWPAYESQVLEQQQILFIKTNDGYVFSDKPFHAKKAASKRLEQLITELCRKAGVRDS